MVLPHYTNPNFWSNPIVWNIFLPHLSYEDARNLMQAAGVDLAFHEYTRCPLPCDSSMNPFPRIQHPTNWRYPVIYHPLPTPHCGNQAHFDNKATGHREPSFCQAPHNQPRPVPGQFIPVPGNPNPHPLTVPRVCAQCKEARADDWEWRLREIKFGVCKTCRKWALDNMQPGQDDCTCPGSARYTGGVNNNEPRYKHLCYQHEIRYYYTIYQASYREVEHRRRLVRLKAPKKRGHGWTRRKGQNRVAKTPHQRRQATQPVRFTPLLVVTQGPPQQAHPRCYCGNKVTLDELRDMASALHPGPANEPARVRSCCGCNGFVRRW